MTEKVLNVLDDGDVHDTLLGHMNEGETAEEALRRLLFALPSWNDLKCQTCGADLQPLDENDWIAWRLQTEGGHRRTDLYCGPTCLSKSLDGVFGATTA